MRRSLADLIANADALADSFENFEPAQDDLEAPLPPLMAVKLAAFRRVQAEKDLADAIAQGRGEKDLADAIAQGREANLSWRELGEAIGTSGEAVRQRYAAN